MKTNSQFVVRINQSIVRRLRDGQRGQGYIGFFAILAVGLLAVSAFVIDAGRLYYGYQQLVAQTQTAALAAGGVMANEGETASEVTAQVNNYSGVSGDLNANSALLTNVKITSTPLCLTGTSTLAMPPCTAYSMGDNAIVVTETATVPTTFAKLLGINSWNISATATAAAKGGFNGPYNVEIIVDTTQSMNDADEGSCSGASRISCALAGIRVLLSTLSPCPGGVSCGSATESSMNVYGVQQPNNNTALLQGTENAYNVATPVDEVGLMTFPGLAGTSWVTDDLNCPAQTPPITAYNGYYAGNNGVKGCSGNGDPWSCCTGSGTGTCGSASDNTPPVYQIVPFSSDYRASDSATSLNTSSDLVIATGGGCSGGLAAPGGEGTFYAGAIYAAQANLVQNARPNTKNVIVILSDGNATATGGPGYIVSSSPGCTSKGSTVGLAGCTTSYTNTDECTQAVKAAQYAAINGTTIYSVAYGAEASGCSGDTLTPCETMEGIANSPSTSSPYYVNNLNNFFSDYAATGGTNTCVSQARPTTSLNEIFQEIGEDLTVSRLVPNGTP